MKKVFKISLLFVFILGLLSAFYLAIYAKKTLKIQTPAGEIISFQVEQALTPEEQRLGLMNRERMSPKTGMIFLFQPPRVARMWMKNTLIPLDMIFFNQKGKVVYVHHNAIPMDETIISSIRPVAGVLEINAGEAKKYGIQKGTRLDLKAFNKIFK